MIEENTRWIPIFWGGVCHGKNLWERHRRHLHHIILFSAIIILEKNRISIVACAMSYIFHSISFLTVSIIQRVKFTLYEICIHITLTVTIWNSTYCDSINFSSFCDFLMIVTCYLVPRKDSKLKKIKRIDSRVDDWKNAIFFHKSIRN